MTIAGSAMGAIQRFISSCYAGVSTSGALVAGCSRRQRRIQATPAMLARHAGVDRRRCSPPSAALSSPWALRPAVPAHARVGLCQHGRGGHAGTFKQPCFRSTESTARRTSSLPAPCRLSENGAHAAQRDVHPEPWTSPRAPSAAMRLTVRRFRAKPDKQIVDRQAASPSSWKTPFMAAWMAS